MASLSFSVYMGSNFLNNEEFLNEEIDINR